MAVHDDVGAGGGGPALPALPRPVSSGSLRLPQPELTARLPSSIVRHSVATGTDDASNTGARERTGARLVPAASGGAAKRPPLFASGGTVDASTTPTPPSSLKGPSKQSGAPSGKSWLARDAAVGAAPPPTAAGTATAATAKAEQMPLLGIAADEPSLPNGVQIVDADELAAHVRRFQGKRSGMTCREACCLVLLNNLIVLAFLFLLYYLSYALAPIVIIPNAGRGPEIFNDIPLGDFAVNGSTIRNLNASRPFNLSAPADMSISVGAGGTLSLASPSIVIGSDLFLRTGGVLSTSAPSGLLIAATSLSIGPTSGALASRAGGVPDPLAVTIGGNLVVQNASMLVSGTLYASNLTASGSVTAAFLESPVIQTASLIANGTVSTQTLSTGPLSATSLTTTGIAAPGNLTLLSTGVLNLTAPRIILATGTPLTISGQLAVGGATLQPSDTVAVAGNMRLVGSLSLPACTAAYRGTLRTLLAEANNGTDGLMMCVRTNRGEYQWQPIASAAAVQSFSTAFAVAPGETVRRGDVVSYTTSGLAVGTGPTMTVNRTAATNTTVSTSVSLGGSLVGTFYVSGNALLYVVVDTSTGVISPPATVSTQLLILEVVAAALSDFTVAVHYVRDFGVAGVQGYLNACRGTDTTSAPQCGTERVMTSFLTSTTRKTMYASLSQTDTLEATMSFVARITITFSCWVYRVVVVGTSPPTVNAFSSAAAQALNSVTSEFSRNIAMMSSRLVLVTYMQTGADARLALLDYSSGSYVQAYANSFNLGAGTVMAMALINETGTTATALLTWSAASSRAATSVLVIDKVARTVTVGPTSEVFSTAGVSSLDLLRVSATEGVLFIRTDLSFGAAFLIRLALAGQDGFVTGTAFMLDNYVTSGALVTLNGTGAFGVAYCYSADRSVRLLTMKLRGGLLPIGISQEDGVGGDFVSVAVGGLSSVHSQLSAGNVYSAMPNGTLVLSTTNQPIGIAISSSSLLITL